MNIKVHRGLDQIGGCITEISTETSRVFIDFGQNLPGNGEPTTPEEDEVLVTQIFAQNKKQHEAVFYTHGHEDHVGLFEYIPEDVPQERRNQRITGDKVRCSLRGRRLKSQ